MNISTYLNREYGKIVKHGLNNVAAKSGISVSSLSEIIRGNRGIKVSQLQKLESAGYVISPSLLLKVFDRIEENKESKGKSSYEHQNEELRKLLTICRYELHPAIHHKLFEKIDKALLGE